LAEACSNRKNAPGKFLWAVNAATGSEIWRYESRFQFGATNTDCTNTPVAEGDTVVFTTANAVAAVRASTGKPLWNHLVTVLSGGYPKALVLSEPIIGAGVVFAANDRALLSWSAGDGHPLGELPGKVGTDPQVVHMVTYEGTLVVSR
jgi:outer membrane protein assembly factor BamB